MEWNYLHTVCSVPRSHGGPAMDDLVRTVSALTDEGWELMSLFQGQPDMTDTCRIEAMWRQVAS